MVTLLLRQWRIRRGLSLHGLAHRAGCSHATIAKIENGSMSPTLATLERLAGGLDISMRELFPVERRKRLKKGG
jgi:transcriptional regulator with XRE-family HTH domain